MSKKLREACKLFFEHTHSPTCQYSRRLVLDPESCTRCMAERDMRAALTTTDTPPEPTDEMVEDGMQAMGYKAEGRPYGGVRKRFIKGLRAALKQTPENFTASGDVKGDLHPEDAPPEVTKDRRSNRKHIPVTVTQLSAAEIVAAKTGDTWLMSIGGHKVWTGIDNCALKWQAGLIEAALESALAAHTKQEG